MDRLWQAAIAAFSRLLRTKSGFYDFLLPKKSLAYGVRSRDSNQTVGRGMPGAGRAVEIGTIIEYRSEDLMRHREVIADFLENYMLLRGNHTDSKQEMLESADKLLEKLGLDLQGTKRHDR